MKNLFLRLKADERIRFLFVGGLNTIVGYGIFAILLLTAEDHFGYLGALYISYVIGVAFAFVLHRRVTFKVTGNLVIDFLRFASVYVVSLAINTAVLPLLVELANIPPLAAQAITLVITTIASYVGHKLFSFRRAKVVDDPAQPVASD